MLAPTAAPIDQRFAQLIQQFGLTKNSFALSLGKTASVVQHLIDGRNKPGFDLLCRVFEIYPNVSRDWLLLGRGPMLIGGEAPPKWAVPAAPAANEQPLEPIDLTDVAPAAPRRTGPGGAGTRLQPAEIAATLALAAAANPSAGAISTVAPEHPQTMPPTRSTTAPSVPLTAAPAMAPAQPPAGPGSVAASGPASAPGPAPLFGPSPEAYVTAALHAQHLQHQLALAEQRNQHLVEQQQMLREMLALVQRERG